MVIYFFRSMPSCSIYLRNNYIDPYDITLRVYVSHLWNKILDDADDLVDQIEDTVQFLFLISQLCLCLSEDVSVSVPVHFGHFFNLQRIDHPRFFFFLNIYIFTN